MKISQRDSSSSSLRWYTRRREKVLNKRKARVSQLALKRLRRSSLVNRDHSYNIDQRDQ